VGPVVSVDAVENRKFVDPARNVIAIPRSACRTVSTPTELGLLPDITTAVAVYCKECETWSLVFVNDRRLGEFEKWVEPEREEEESCIVINCTVD
jgi:hypothetical protein